MNKADIIINKKVYTWRYTNALNNKWTVNGSGGELYFCKKTHQGGFMNVSEQDDILTLTSLYITNFYQQMTIAIMIAVFVPIYVSVFT
jgi:hypothetical protein